MNESDINAIVDDFPTEVEVTSDRRGFGKQRGVPDSVFWLSPATDDIPSKLLPILVELEGSFNGAADDFTKFADRADDEEYQYYLQWPIFDIVEQAPISRGIEYDVIGIRATQLTQQWSIEEQDMHEAFNDWCKKFKSKFKTTTTVLEVGDTAVLKWNIEITMFGHKYSIYIPFILDPGSNLETVLNKRLDTPKIPSVVVVNQKYDNREGTSYYHDTQIRFAEIVPSKLQMIP